MGLLMRISIQQLIIPDYRMGHFLLLRKEWGSDFQIFAGDADFGGSPVSVPDAWKYFQRVQNWYFFDGRFVWQKGCFRKLVSSDVVILNGNMRILSNNLLLLVRKLFRRKTILWGHIEGQNTFASFFRGLYFRFCDGFIAYTESQAHQVRLRYPWLKVWVAPNSCVAASDCREIRKSSSFADTILYVGRLVPGKKVKLLLQAFIFAKKNGLITNEIKLIFVGDGTEQASLVAMSDEAGVSFSVSFAGHISDVDQLRDFYSRAICAVSPGYVGLSATQSFSFGVPMLVANDEFHSPEIEACREGFNSRFFASDDFEALASELQRVCSSRSGLFASGKKIAQWTRNNYSFEAMRDAFAQAVKEV